MDEELATDTYLGHEYNTAVLEASRKLRVRVVLYPTHPVFTIYAAYGAVAGIRNSIDNSMCAYFDVPRNKKHREIAEEYIRELIAVEYEYG